MVFGIPTLGDNDANGPDLRTVKRGQFVHRVTETGDIESSENVEIRCEVKARGTQGTQIIEVVAEGTMVKAGDVLVRLDATAFETELTGQEMAVNKAKASMTQAESAYKTAQIAKREYFEGTYSQELSGLEGDKVVAQENERRAKQYLEYSQRLAAKGYVTALQLEADRFAVRKAEIELQAAEDKIGVLSGPTREKKEIELNADIKTTKAKLDAEQNSLDLEIQKFEDIQQQIEKCVVYAPSDGQVVHANQRSRRGGNDVVIEPGVLIRQNQVMIRLPDPSKMQVKAKINEARVDLVKPNMTATISVGAFPDMELRGKVEKVSRYAEPGSWFSSNVKTYATFIKIDGSHEKLRPGLTAEVEIEVTRLEDALMLPITCIAEHGGKHYCMVRRDSEWEPQPREVKLGPSNETMVVIKSGVDEGETVAANPQRHRQHATWPKLRDDDDEQETSPGKPAPQAPASGPNPSSGGNPIAKMFGAMDTNKDGKVTQEEVGAERWQFASRADSNKDGAVTRSEMAAAMAAMGGGGGPPGGGQGAMP